MLPFFTKPYPNELLYSAIARYGILIVKTNCKSCLRVCMILSVEIGSYVSVLTEKLGSHYSVETLLANHIIYPYYACFYQKRNRKKFCRMFYTSDNQNIQDMVL